MPSRERKKAVVIVHNIRSAHNVGSIFRTADAVGVEKIYLCGYTPIPEPRGKKSGNAKIAKTALGAEKTVPWEYHAQASTLVRRLKQQDYQIVALEQTQRSVDVFLFRPKPSIAIIVGNEVRGLPATILKLSDAVVEIPMRGKKESLNVSVAFGIAVYTLLR